MNKTEYLLPIRGELNKKYKGEYIITRNKSENLDLIKGNTINITNYGKKLLLRHQFYW